MSVKLLFSHHAFHDDVGCSRAALHIVGTCFATLVTELVVRDEARDDGVEAVIVGHLEAALTCQQVLSLLEALVVGTEQYGNTPHSRFRHVVNAYAEAAAHISNLAVTIDGGEQTEAVDDETACLGCRLLCGLRVAHGLHLQLVKDVSQMVFTYDVWRDDKLPVRMVVEETNEDVFIGLPA